MSEKKNDLIWINKWSENQVSKGVEGKYGSSVRIPFGDGVFGNAFIAAQKPSTTKDGERIEGKVNVALSPRAKVIFKDPADAKAVAESFGDKAAYDGEKNPRAFYVDAVSLKDRINAERSAYAKTHAAEKSERRIPDAPAEETEVQAEEQAEV